MQPTAPDRYERWQAHAAQRRRRIHAVATISLSVARSSAEEREDERYWDDLAHKWRSDLLPGARLDPIELGAAEALHDAPICAVARELMRLALPEVNLAITAKRQAQLEAAARRLDHYSGRRGAWIEQAAIILNCWHGGEIAGWVTEPPRSLGALAVELRRHANDRRHYALERRAQGPVRTAARERQITKRWRRKLRAAEHQAPGAGWSLRRPRDED